MNTLVTFQEFQRAGDKAKFIAEAISRHKASELYANAISADKYYRQRNETICKLMSTVWTLQGTKVNDPTASTSRLASNFFKRLNIQRCMYSLGNGISFANATQDGDATKEQMGNRFDDDVKTFGLYALIHGISFPFWNLDHIDTFTVTEFVPLWDEYSGALKAGIRFWQLSNEHQVNATLYEEDGYTNYVSQGNSAKDFRAVDEKHGYKITYIEVPADGMRIAVEENNYTKLPIIPVWGSDAHQSTLVGMREAIDSYDIIKSGFADDVRDCAEIYWIVENYGGMSESDLAKFRDRLKLTHIAEADTADGGKVTPYTQDIPFQAREAVLNRIRNDMYEDFGALDVHTVAAGSTNDHIDAAYQPMDEEADDFERHIRECIMDILALNGIDDTPVFSRNRVSNQREQVEIILMEANYLDEETILRKLPNITPDEVQGILERKDGIDSERFSAPAIEGEE